MFVIYPYRNYLSRYAAGFVDTERREGPESLATVPISVARPGRGAGGRRAAGPALGTSRMQFTNTSDATLQTDTNQHNAGGELHATLLNNEPYQHTRPHPMGGRRGADQRCKASPRDPEGLAGQRAGAPPHTAPQAPPVWRAPEGPTAPGTQVTPQPTKPKARVWRSRGRAAAHRHTQRPSPTEQATRRQGLAGLQEDTPRQSSAHPAPPVWRAPEGPEGTGGLRGAAPNKVRSPSLAGGRALRRPEHPWGHKQHEAARPHRGRAAHASGR